MSKCKITSLNPDADVFNSMNGTIMSKPVNSEAKVSIATTEMARIGPSIFGTIENMPVIFLADTRLKVRSIVSDA